MPHFGISYLSPAAAIARLASVIVMALVSLVIVSVSARPVPAGCPCQTTGSVLSAQAGDRQEGSGTAPAGVARPDLPTVSPGLAS